MNYDDHYYYGDEECHNIVEVDVNFLRDACKNMSDHSKGLYVDIDVARSYVDELEQVAADIMTIAKKLKEV